MFIQIDGVNKLIDNVIKVETKIDGKSIKCLRMNDFHFIKVINIKDDSIIISHNGYQQFTQLD